MEAMRIVKMKSGKFAIQRGMEVEDNLPFDRSFVYCTHVEWYFEEGRTDKARLEWGRILFDKEIEAEAYIQKWLNENTISEIRTEFYINEEK